MLILDLIIVIKKYRYRSKSNIIINYYKNKKPHKKVGLFELKKVNYLFQQDHLFGLAELSCLDRIDV